MFRIQSNRITPSINALPAPSSTIFRQLIPVCATSLQRTSRIAPSAMREQKNNTLHKVTLSDAQEQQSVFISDSLINNDTRDLTAASSSQQSIQAQTPPRDPKLSRRAKQLVGSLEQIQKRLPANVVKSAFDRAKQGIEKNAIEGSLTVKFATEFLDKLQLTQGVDNQVDKADREEYTYLLLKTLAILDKTAQTLDGEQHASLISSVVFSGVENVISSPFRADPMGALSLSKSLFDTILGQRKADTYDLLTSFKNSLLSNLGKEDSSSFTAKMKLFLYLAISIDTGQDVPTADFVSSVQDLGIIPAKMAQTLGGQINNPALQDGGTKSRLLEACTQLQQYNRPMTAETAQSQMAAHFTSTLGPDWQSKLFQSIDFTKPFKTGTIAGVYKGIGANGQPVIVKIKKPGLEQQIADNRREISTLLTASYTILQEAVDSLHRLDQPVPKLLSQAGLFQKSQASLDGFFDRFQSELQFENEAQAMMTTSCTVPKVLSYTPNVIIMDYIDNGVTPLEFIAISEKTQPVEYHKAKNAQDALQGWLQSHYPHTIAPNGVSQQDDAHFSVAFKDKALPSMDLQVQHTGRRWTVQPTTPYVDYSPASREILAAQSIADLITQLSDGLLNCDTHGGNFIVAPSEKPGVNTVYNIDFGLVANIDSAESKLAWNFIKGFIFKNEETIGRSYLDMTTKGLELDKVDYDHALKAFTQTLKDSHYTQMLAKDPDLAMGPVMKWMAKENFNIDAKFYAIIRSFAGVASNAALIQGGKPPTARQFAHLANQIVRNKNLVNGHIVQDCLKVLTSSRVPQAFISAVQAFGVRFAGPR